MKEFIGKHVVHRIPMHTGWDQEHTFIEERDVVLMAISGTWAMVRRRGAVPYVAPVKELFVNREGR